MNSAIGFNQISKLYRLGPRQTSLREALSNSVAGILGRDHRRSGDHGFVWALKETSFEVESGRALGLIGPNGAGKTTVLKILAGITKPTSGHFTVHGRVSALIELGAGFHPDLTGQENIYLYGAILGLSRREIDRMLDRIIDFSGLEPFIETPVKRYSSGMYVRLAFAVAAHVEPDVLLVDEVLAVGDAQFRQKCAERVQELRNLGTTIIFVAHNLYLVKSVCEVGLFLAEGQVREQGDVISVINAYETWLQGQQVDASGPRRFAVEGEFEGASFVRIERVEILDMNGNHVDAVSHSDRVNIHINFTARKPLPNPNVVLRIVRTDGVTCCMIRTVDHGFVLEDLEDEGVISLVLDPVQLAGGTYAIDVRLTGALDGLPLAQAHSRWFRVFGVGLGDDSNRGVYVPRVASAYVVPTAQLNYRVEGEVITGD